MINQVLIIPMVGMMVQPYKMTGRAINDLSKLNKRRSSNAMF